MPHSGNAIEATQTQAAGLKGHLLLIHGTMDNNVPPYNTLLVADALMKANKEFDMILVPNSGHGYAPANYIMRRLRPIPIRRVSMGRADAAHVLACPRCGGRLRLVALMEEPSVVRRILRHLGLPTELPEPRPARAPPREPNVTEQGSPGDGTGLGHGMVTASRRRGEAWERCAPFVAPRRRSAISAWHLDSIRHPRAAS